MKFCSWMRWFVLSLVLLSGQGYPSANVQAQAGPETVSPLLEKPVQLPVVPAYQLRRYMAARAARPAVPASAEAWARQAQTYRRHVLEDIAFHGWPQEWIRSAPRFEQTEVIESANGYRRRKFRYEIVPGFESTAVLYEPTSLNGRVPGVLNLVGHDPLGNAVEYEQKRCINLAKNGMLALSLAWPGFGELNQADNSHDFGGQLDLVGANSLGFFYLIMRRGLDFLESLPNADPKRLGVTGLSGGGWQTTVLSALDERVSVMVEVAGIGSMESNLARPTDTQEVEETPTDLLQQFDYPFLLAMRAPRPTLLIHNQQDDCCFLAPLVKPYVYEQIRPFFRLFNAEDSFRWHENVDPGTHNYQLDNRQQAYAFFSEFFRIPKITQEIPSGSEILSPEEFKGSLPQDNLTTAGLARRLAGEIRREAIPADGAGRDSWAKSQREKLKSVLHYSEVSVVTPWRLVSTKRPGLQAFSYQFEFSNSLGAAGIWVAGNHLVSNAPLTIVLNDKGYKASAQIVAERVNRGEQVLALDPIFFGASSPDETDPAYWELLLTGSGERPLGIEVGQLLAIAKFFASAQSKIRVETAGIRAQTVGLAAAGMEPALFSGVYSHEGMNSLQYLLDAPVPYRTAPDLFCLDLFKYFDLDRLAAMASGVKIESAKPASAKPH